MQKRVLYFVAAFLAGSILAGSALAKVWLLPDYQQRQFYSHRTNTPGDNQGPNNPGPDGRSCSVYGGIEASSLSVGQVCEGAFYIGSTKCCKSSSCSSVYKYTAAECSKDGKIGCGESCSDGDGTHYTQCKCNSSSYPYSSSSCVPELSGASCSDDDGTHYQECVEDPCAVKEEVTCAKALGCAETCGDICVRCNDQPDCDNGSHWNDDLGCVLDTCPIGYSTDVGKDTSCGLAYSNSHWEVGTEINGQSGSTPCYNCRMVCDEGYGEFNTFWCGIKPTVFDCEDLGYQQPKLGIEICPAGTTKILCPFDTTYFACAGKLEPIVIPPTEGECKTGQELATLPDGSRKCYSSKCATIAPNTFVRGVKDFVTFDNGYRAAHSCMTGAVGSFDSNFCLSCKLLPVDPGGGGSGTLCVISTREKACSMCNNVAHVDANGCYVCGAGANGERINCFSIEL